MSGLELGPGITLEGIDENLVSNASDRRRRSMGQAFIGDEFADDLDEALRSADFIVAADTQISPDEEALSRRGIEDEPSDQPPQLHVSVEAGEAAVLLVQNAEGVYHWQFPESDDKFGSARRSADAETLTFNLASPVNQEREGGGRRGIGDVLGWVADKLIEPVRVRVLRYAASKTIKAAVAKIEHDLPTGLVWLDGSDDQFLVTKKQPPVPSANGRVLLLVHGTFSSTEGSFGGLAIKHNNYPSFLDNAREHYDLILGYNHKTLGEKPDQNAKDMLDALSFLPAGTPIDAVAFSRGGLVYRSFAEVQAAEGRFDFGKAIFVGCTNSGTYLAEPENWEDLVGLYTNIGLAGARALSILGSPVAGRIAAEVIKLLGGFVQALPELAIEDKEVPGLAAMRPKGEFVQDLNAGTSPIERYRAITSNFEPRPSGGNGLTGGVAGYLADRVMDRLLQEENDLVVHTASMISFGKGEELPGEVIRRFRPSDAVYHTVYFQSSRVSDWLADWLLAPLSQDEEEGSAGPDDDGGGSGGAAARTAAPATPSPSPSPSETTYRSVSDEADTDNYRPTRRGMGEDEFLVPPGAGYEYFEEGDVEDIDGSPKLAGIEGEPVDKAIEPATSSAPYFFAAEMAATPPIGITPLSVAISREQIRVAAHAAAQAAKEGMELDLDTDVSITVLAKENCKILPGQPGMNVSKTNAWAELDIPVPASYAQVRFLVEGKAGKATVQVEINQGPATLASFTLYPFFIDLDVQRLSQDQTAFSMQPNADYPMVLKIFELGSEKSGHVIKYDLVSKDPKFAVTQETQLNPGFSLAIFSKDLIEEFNKQHDLSKLEYRTALRNLSAASLNATNELLPEAIREKLVEHWDKLTAIQVFSENPHLPWELLSVKRKDAGPGETSFLAERGLVRWVYNVNPPGARIPIRDGRVRHVIPKYLNKAHNLKYADREKVMLETLFPGATSAGTTSEDVSTFLYKEAQDCDLLHFTCHGNTSHSSVMSADLYMEGFPKKNGKGFKHDKFSAGVAKEWSHFAEGADPHSLVFVNACRAGEAGNSIAGTTGFADAFLNPNSKRGAAAFVGALWKIEDEYAYEFADEFYTAMLRDKAKLIEAAQRGRNRLKEHKTDFTWLAYTIYGNPMARFVTEE